MFTLKGEEFETYYAMANPKEFLAITLSNQKEIFKLYPSSVTLLKKFVKEERDKDVVYSHTQFFKGNKLKKQIDDYFDSLTD